MIHINYRLIATNIPPNVAVALEKTKEYQCIGGGNILWRGFEPGDVPAMVKEVFLGFLPRQVDRRSVKFQWEMFEGGEWVECDDPSKPVWS